MSDLRQRIAHLSPEKRALLERRLMERRLPTAYETIPRRATSGPCSLSFAQQRLWFLGQMEPESPFYNEPKAVRIHGPLNVAALHHALNSIVARHEVLRTTFVADNGSPIQDIAAPRSVQLTVIDLRTQPAAARAQETQRRLDEAMQRPFDLTSDLTLRVLLLQLDDEEHVLLIVTHHIASDRWSTGILFRELSTLYDACMRGDRAPLPELPIQYADYALWQRQWLQGEVLEGQLSYWTQHLDGAPARLELPTDRLRSAVQTFRGARRLFTLASSLSEPLKALSRQEGVTLFMLLLAAFQTLLQRYTGQDDIVVGSPIAGRTRKETEGLIGCFVNTLTLRTNLAGNPPFRAVLLQVREVTLGAYEHQELPFEKLVEVLQPERHLSHAPLCQVTFAFQNVPWLPLQLPGLSITPLDVNTGTAKFDLSLSMWEENDGLTGAWSYSSDLFDAATITRLQGHWQTLLGGIITNPEQRLTDLPLLTLAERQQVLVAWNNTGVDYPGDGDIPHRFEAQVQRAPDTVAVVCGEGSLTYQELNRRANQLAHYLRQQGVGPEVLVGLCTERSPEMVVGLLGILKAGGAYVPLDPTYPKDRLAFMLADAALPVLLTQKRLVEALPTHRAHVVCLDTDWEAIAGADEANPVCRVTAANLAYVIYTSGSTGRPKGVMTSHGSLVNYLTWCTQAYPVAAGQGTPVHSSLAFDLTITGLFAPLLVGRRLTLVPEHLGLEGFSTALRDQRDYSLVKLTPSHLELLGHQIPEAEATGLTRAMVIGGEALLPEHVAFWQRSAPATALINEYGPTETVVGCCIYHVPAEMPASGTIPIGRPISNTQLYILDANGQPVPIGVPGELHIGGAGVVRGYLARPALTVERFIPDPFSDEPGARLYKTGDQARYLPDGDIEFLGRLDHQVKVRGFRIELGEIEVVLRQHPAVRETVVLAREDSPGNPRLVAYVVSSCAEQSPPLDGLRRFLQQQLPDHMVPSAFVCLDTLPLTPNGKVDRDTLPAPNATRPDLAAGFVLPQTPVEAQLAAIWCQVLGLNQVGIYDNFFALGGHSLLAVQVLSRLRVTFQVELPLRSLFEVPTVVDLAEQIETLRWALQEQADPLKPTGNDSEEIML